MANTSIGDMEHPSRTAIHPKTEEERKTSRAADSLNEEVQKMIGIVPSETTAVFTEKQVSDLRNDGFIFNPTTGSSDKTACKLSSNSSGNALNELDLNTGNVRMRKEAIVRSIGGVNEEAESAVRALGRCESQRTPERNPPKNEASGKTEKDLVLEAGSCLIAKTVSEIRSQQDAELGRGPVETTPDPNIQASSGSTHTENVKYQHEETLEGWRNFPGEGERVEGTCGNLPDTALGGVSSKVYERPKEQNRTELLMKAPIVPIAEPTEPNVELAAKAITQQHNCHGVESQEKPVARESRKQSVKREGECRCELSCESCKVSKDGEDNEQDSPEELAFEAPHKRRLCARAKQYPLPSSDVVEEGICENNSSRCGPADRETEVFSDCAVLVSGYTGVAVVIHREASKNPFTETKSDVFVNSTKQEIMKDGFARKTPANTKRNEDNTKRPSGKVEKTSGEDVVQPVKDVMVKLYEEVIVQPSADVVMQPIDVIVQPNEGVIVRPSENGEHVVQPSEDGEDVVQPSEDDMMQLREDVMVKPRVGVMVQPNEDGVVQPCGDDMVQPNEDVMVKPCEDVMVRPSEVVIVQPSEDVMVKPRVGVIVQSDEGVVIEQPKEDVIVQPGENVMVQPSEDVIVQPSEDVIGQPGEDVVMQPSDVIVQPNEDVMVKPRVGVMVQPNEDSVMQPCGDDMVQPNEDSVMQPCGDDMVQPNEDVMVKPREDVMVRPSKVVIVQPSHDVIVQPSEDDIVQPIEDVIVRPSEDVMVKPSVGVIVQPDEDVMVKPSEDVIGQPREDLIVQPSEDDMGQPGENVMVQPSEDDIVQLYVMVKPSEYVMIKPIEHIIKTDSENVIVKPSEDVILKCSEDDLILSNIDVMMQPDVVVMVKPSEDATVKPSRSEEAVQRRSEGVMERRNEEVKERRSEVEERRSGEVMERRNEEVQERQSKQVMKRRSEKVMQTSNEVVTDTPSEMAQTGEEPGHGRNEEIARIQTEEPNDGRNEEISEMKTEAPGDEPNEEIAEIQIEEPGDGRNEEISEMKTEGPGDGRDQDIADIQSEEPGDVRNGEIVQMQTEQPDAGRNEEIVQMQTEKPDVGRNEEIVQILTAQPGVGRSEEICEIQTEEPGDGRNKEIAEIQTEEPDDGRNEEIAEIQTEEPDDGRNKEICEIQTKEPDDGRDDEIADIQSEEPGDVRNGEIAQVQSKKPGDGGNEEMAEIQAEEPDGEHNEEIAEIQTEEPDDWRNGEIAQIQTKERGDGRNEEIAEIQAEEPDDGRNGEIAEIQAEEPGDGHNGEIVQILTAHPGVGRSEEICEIQTEEPGDGRNEEIAEIQTEESDDGRNEGIAEIQTEEPGDGRNEEIAEIQTEEPDDVRNEEIAEIQTEEPDDGRNEGIAEIQTEEPDDGRNEEIAEIQTEEPDDRRNEEIAEIQTEEPDDGRFEEICEIETEEPDDVHDEEIAEIQTEEPDDRRNEEIDEIQTEEPGDGRNEEIAEIQTEEPDDVRNEEIAEIQTEEPDDGRNEGIAEIQTEEPDDGRNEEIAEIQTEEPDDRRNEEIAEIQTEEPDDGRDGEIADIQSEEPDAGRNEEIAEIQTEEPDDGRFEEIDEIQTEELDDRRNGEIAQMQTKERGDGRNEEIAEIHTEEPGDGRDEEIVEIQTEEPDAGRNEEIADIQAEEPGDRHNGEIAQMQNKEPGDGRNEEVSEMKTEEPGEGRDQEIADIQAEEPFDRRNEEIAEIQTEEPGDMRNEEIAQMQTEQPGVERSEEICDIQTEELDDGRNEAIAEIQTEEPDDGCNEGIAEIQTEEPGDVRNGEIVQTQTEEAGDGRNEEIAEIQTEEPDDGRNEEIAEIQTEEPDDGRFEEIAEIQTEEPDDGRNEEIAEIQTEEPDDGRFEEIAEIQTEEPDDRRNEEIAEIQTEEPDDGRFEEICEIQNEQPVHVQDEKSSGIPTEEQTAIPIDEPVELSDEHVCQVASEVVTGSVTKQIDDMESEEAVCMSAEHVCDVRKERVAEIQYQLDAVMPSVSVLQLPKERVLEMSGEKISHVQSEKGLVMASKQPTHKSRGGQACKSPRVEIPSKQDREAQDVHIQNEKMSDVHLAVSNEELAEISSGGEIESVEVAAMPMGEVHGSEDMLVVHVPNEEIANKQHVEKESEEDLEISGEQFIEMAIEETTEARNGSCLISRELVSETPSGHIAERPKDEISGLPVKRVIDDAPHEQVIKMSEEQGANSHNEQVTDKQRGEIAVIGNEQVSEIKNQLLKKARIKEVVVPESKKRNDNTAVMLIDSTAETPCDVGELLGEPDVIQRQSVIGLKTEQLIEESNENGAGVPNDSVLTSQTVNRQTAEIATSVPKQISVRIVPEKAAEVLTGHAGEETAEVLTDHAGEEAAELLTGHAGEEAAEVLTGHAGEGAVEVLTGHAGEEAAEVLTGHAGEEAAEVLTDQAGEEAAEVLTDQAGEEAAEVLTGHAGEEAAEVLTGHAGEEAAEVLTGHAGEKGAEVLTGHAGEKGAEVLTGHAGEEAAEMLTGHAGEEAAEVLTDQAGEEAAEVLTGHAGEEAAEVLTGHAGEEAAEVLTGHAGEKGAEVLTGHAGEKGAEVLTGLAGEKGAEVLTGHAGEDVLLIRESEEIEGRNASEVPRASGIDPKHELLASQTTSGTAAAYNEQIRSRSQQAANAEMLVSIDDASAETATELFLVKTVRRQDVTDLNVSQSEGKDFETSQSVGADIVDYSEDGQSEDLCLLLEESQSDDTAENNSRETVEMREDDDAEAEPRQTQADSEQESSTGDLRSQPENDNTKAETTRIMKLTCSEYEPSVDEESEAVEKSKPATAGPEIIKEETVTKRAVPGQAQDTSVLFQEKGEATFKAHFKPRRGPNAKSLNGQADDISCVEPGERFVRREEWSATAQPVDFAEWQEQALKVEKIPVVEQRKGHAGLPSNPFVEQTKISGNVSLQLVTEKSGEDIGVDTVLPCGGVHMSYTESSAVKQGCSVDREETPGTEPSTDAKRGDKLAANATSRDPLAEAAEESSSGLRGESPHCPPHSTPAITSIQDSGVTNCNTDCEQDIYAEGVGQSDGRYTEKTLNFSSDSDDLYGSANESTDTAEQEVSDDGTCRLTPEGQVSERQSNFSQTRVPPHSSSLDSGGQMVRMCDIEFSKEDEMQCRITEKEVLSASCSGVSTSQDQLQAPMSASSPLRQERETPNVLKGNQTDVSTKCKLSRPASAVEISKDKLQDAVALNVGRTLISLENRPKTPMYSVCKLTGSPCQSKENATLSSKRFRHEDSLLPEKRQKCLPQNQTSNNATFESLKSLVKANERGRARRSSPSQCSSRASSRISSSPFGIAAIHTFRQNMCLTHPDSLLSLSLTQPSSPEEGQFSDAESDGCLNDFVLAGALQQLHGRAAEGGRQVASEWVSAGAEEQPRGRAAEGGRQVASEWVSAGAEEQPRGRAAEGGRHEDSVHSAPDRKKATDRRVGRQKSRQSCAPHDDKKRKRDDSEDDDDECKCIKTDDRIRGGSDQLIEGKSSGSCAFSYTDKHHQHSGPSDTGHDANAPENCDDSGQLQSEDCCLFLEKSEPLYSDDVSAAMVKHPENSSVEVFSAKTAEGLALSKEDLPTGVSVVGKTEVSCDPGHESTIDGVDKKGSSPAQSGASGDHSVRVYAEGNRLEEQVKSCGDEDVTSRLQSGFDTPANSNLMPNEAKQSVDNRCEKDEALENRARDHSVTPGKSQLSQNAGEGRPVATSGETVPAGRMGDAGPPAESGDAEREDMHKQRSHDLAGVPQLTETSDVDMSKCFPVADVVGAAKPDCAADGVEVSAKPGIRRESGRIDRPHKALCKAEETPGLAELQNVVSENATLLSVDVLRARDTKYTCTNTDCFEISHGHKDEEMFSKNYPLELALSDDSTRARKREAVGHLPALGDILHKRPRPESSAIGRGDDTCHMSGNISGVRQEAKRCGREHPALWRDVMHCSFDSDTDADLEVAAVNFTALESQTSSCSPSPAAHSSDGGELSPEIAFVVKSRPADVMENKEDRDEEATFRREVNGESERREASGPCAGSRCVEKSVRKHREVSAQSLDMLVAKHASGEYASEMNAQKGAIDGSLSEVMRDLPSTLPPLSADMGPLSNDIFNMDIWKDAGCSRCMEVDSDGNQTRSLLNTEHASSGQPAASDAVKKASGIDGSLSKLSLSVEQARQARPVGHSMNLSLDQACVVNPEAGPILRSGDGELSGGGRVVRNDVQNSRDFPSTSPDRLNVQINRISPDTKILREENNNASHTGVCNGASQLDILGCQAGLGASGARRCLSSSVGVEQVGSATEVAAAQEGAVSCHSSLCGDVYSSESGGLPSDVDMVGNSPAVCPSPSRAVQTVQQPGETNHGRSTQAVCITSDQKRLGNTDECRTETGYRRSPRSPAEHNRSTGTHDTSAHDNMVREDFHDVSVHGDRERGERLSLNTQSNVDLKVRNVFIESTPLQLKERCQGKVDEHKYTEKDGEKMRPGCSLPDLVASGIPQGIELLTEKGITERVRWREGRSGVGGKRPLEAEDEANSLALGPRERVKGTSDGRLVRAGGMEGTSDGRVIRAGGMEGTSDGRVVQAGGMEGTSDGRVVRAGGMEGTSDGRVVQAGGMEGTSDGRVVRAGGKEGTSDGRVVQAGGMEGTSDGRLVRAGGMESTKRVRLDPIERRKETLSSKGFESIERRSGASGGGGAATSSMRGGRTGDRVLLDARNIKQEAPTEGRLASVLERIRQRRHKSSSSRESSACSTPLSHDDGDASQERSADSDPLRQARRQEKVVGNLSLANADSLLRRCQHVLHLLRRIYTCRQGTDVVNKQRVQAWQRELDLQLNKALTLPKTVIAVVGGTGSGKSSLMNALLEHAAVLPTSGLRACTAVVVEVMHNTRSSRLYEAHIDFLSVKEWEDELEVLMTELKTPDGKLKIIRHPDSEAGIACSKIRAVYGALSDSTTLEDFRQDVRITEWLGRTKHVASKSAEEFTKEVNHYIENTESSKGGEFWPIVKQVKIQIPKCRVLSSGAVLVDLPGTRDSNAARDKIAKSFLQQCTTVWVAAEIHRAVNNKTAKDLLGEHFRRQLLMDGHYASITFVCTKVDASLVTEEICRQLQDAEERCRPLATEVRAIEEQVGEANNKIADFSIQLDECEQQVREIHAEMRVIETDMVDLQNSLDEEEKSDVERELKVLQAELRDKTNELESQHRLCSALKADVRTTEAEVDALESVVKQKRSEMLVICAKARNAYAQSQIKRDFRAGLREMRRLGGERVGASDNDEEEEGSYGMEVGESGGEEEFERLAENMRVFCVSSADYLKLTGKLGDRPAVFSCVGDTGIPALQNFIEELTQVRKVRGTERLLYSASQYVSGVLSYLVDQGTADKKTRQFAKEAFFKHVRNVQNVTLEKIVQNVGREVSQTIESLNPRVGQGICHACVRAPDIYGRWASKPNRDEPEKGGLHWATYKAVVQRRGVYKTAKTHPIDFNEDLAAPMYIPIMVEWDRVFNVQLFRLMDSFRRDILVAFKQSAQTLRQEFLGMGISEERVNRAYIQHLQTVSNKVLESVEAVKEYMTDKQRDINRVLAPAVQNNMTPVYDACSAEKGAGCFQRMKNHMATYVSTHTPYIFDTASKTLLDELQTLQEEVVRMMRRVCASLCDGLHAFYEPLWLHPLKTESLRIRYFGEVEACYRQMAAVMEDAGLEFKRARFGDDSCIYTQQTRGVMESVSVAMETAVCELKRRSAVAERSTGQGAPRNVANTDLYQCQRNGIEFKSQAETSIGHQVAQRLSGEKITEVSQQVRGAGAEVSQQVHGAKVRQQVHGAGAEVSQQVHGAEVRQQVRGAGVEVRQQVRGVGTAEAKLPQPPAAVPEERVREDIGAVTDGSLLSDRDLKSTETAANMKFEPNLDQKFNIIERKTLTEKSVSKCGRIYGSGKTSPSCKAESVKCRVRARSTVCNLCRSAMPLQGFCRVCCTQSDDCSQRQPRNQSSDCVKLGDVVRVSGSGEAALGGKAIGQAGSDPAAALVLEKQTDGKLVSASVLQAGISNRPAKRRETGRPVTVSRGPHISATKPQASFKFLKVLPQPGVTKGKAVPSSTRAAASAGDEGTESDVVSAMVSGTARGKATSLGAQAVTPARHRAQKAKSVANTGKSVGKRQRGGQTAGDEGQVTRQGARWRARGRSSWPGARSTPSNRTVTREYGVDLMDSDSSPDDLPAFHITGR